MYAPRHSRFAPSPVGPSSTAAAPLSTSHAARSFSGSAICSPYVRSSVPRASAGLGAPDAAAVSQLQGHEDVGM
jgi:hypothetical protein